MTDTALITGTTSGIGYAIAETLASDRHNLVLVARDAKKMSKQAAYLAGCYHVQVHCIVQDLLHPEAAGKIYQATRDLGLAVNILVNNAGFNEFGPFLGTDGEKETGMIQLHAQRTTEMMKCFLPDMVSAGNGYVLNVGSTGSYMECPNDAVYAATKAYILSLSKAVNAELEGTGVSVTTLCPGSTRTAFAEKAGMSGTWLFRLFVMEPERVARIGCRAMKKRRKAVTPGVYNQLLVFASKHLPSCVLNPVTKILLS